MFDVVDRDADFGGCKVLILPDSVLIAEALAAKLAEFTAGGGKVLATGTSGLAEDGAFALNLGAVALGENPFQPDYFHPRFALPNLGDAAFVCYERGQKIGLADGGEALGDREDPYFNRTAAHFCSHQHTPSVGVPSGPGMTAGPDGIYLAWPMFTDYASKGSLFLRETVVFALKRLLGNARTAETSLPAQGVLTVTEQKASGRYVAHLLYAAPVKRGKDVEVIEDLIPLRDTVLTLRVPSAATRVSLEPQGLELPFELADGVLNVTVPEFTGHQMVAVQYA